ncbi:MAG TPA: hypothetical protein VL330_09115, partial [Actinomycetes bacterium]|nr:hypothetical protein [Actinomycetes bacterium]
SSLPDAIVRAAVTAKLGLGIGALTAAALQLRSLLSAPAGASFEDAPVGGARLWDWDDEPLGFEAWDDPGPPDERFGAALVPELQVVGGRASRRRHPATTASSTTLATVLPWPSHRHPDDPDLPGGA